MKSTIFATLLVLALGTGLQASAAGQAIGALEWVDQDTALGWACDPGNINSFVSVDLWARDTATLQWFFLGTELADKQRNDVGADGVCGNIPEAYLHGFELTIYPEALIALGSSYRIHAYVGSVELQLSGQNLVSFGALGFPTSDTWRTDYDDPDQRLVSMVSCIWPYKGANPKSQLGDGPEIYEFDPLFLNAGATITQPSWDSAPDVVSEANWCLRNNASDPASWYWDHSNSATNAKTWPTSNFWVISANNELAYSKLESGPPSQSQPINNGMFTVSMNQTHFNLAIDNDAKTGYKETNYPFLSLGAEMGRGTAGPIGWIDPTGLDTFVELTVQQISETPGDYHDIAVFVETMWGGYKRFLGISLVLRLQNRYHWNWNALESFWFPGGEFNLLGTKTLDDECDLTTALLPELNASTIGQTIPVSLPLRGILECIEATSLPNNHPGAGGTLGWGIERPTGTRLAITGVHLAIEQSPGELDAAMETRFSKPVLVQR